MICHLCISLSHLVVILYDTISTLSLENDLVWGRQFRIAALLYMMARYGAILYFLAFILALTIATTAQVFVVHLMFHVEYWQSISVCCHIVLWHGICLDVSLQGLFQPVAFFRHYVPFGHSWCPRWVTLSSQDTLESLKTFFRAFNGQNICNLQPQ